jgi:hypothetical protein
MLFSNQKNKYKKVVIDDCTMLFKSLNYNEVKELEEKSKEIGEDLPKLFFYLCDKYIRDENKEKAITEDEVKELPVDFLVNVTKKFLASVSGNLTEEEIKKN